MKYYEQSAALSSISIQLIANAAMQPLTIAGWQPGGVAKQALQSLIKAHQRGEPLPISIAGLAKGHPLAPEVIAALRQIVVNTGRDEAEVLKAFYALLAEDEAAKGLDRAFRSAMRGSILGSRAHRGLRSTLKKEIFR